VIGTPSPHDGVSRSAPADVGAAWQPADTSPKLDRRPIGRVLADQAAANVDAAAVCWLAADGTLHELTYGRLFSAAARLAAHLTREFPGQSRVAVWSPNRSEWLVLLYAAALAGLILTPLNPALADAEVEVLLGQSGAAVVYAATEHRGSPLLDRARAMTARSGPPVRAMDTVWRDGVDPAPGDLPEVDQDTPFLLQYTSGTTGRPKGVVLSHLAAVNSARFSSERLGLRATDTWLTCLPLHHVGGSVCNALPMVMCGGCVALQSGWDVEQAVDLVAASGSTVVGGVPTMLLDLLEHPAVRDGRLATVRILQVGGSTVAPTLIRRLEATVGATIMVGYGQSEAPVTVVSGRDDSPEIKATTIGTVLPHREVRIADPVTGAALGYGEVGELQIRSPLSMTGYWHDAEASAAAIDADGWLHSGDLCSMAADGHLTFQGRWRDLIIRGGENIYPAEIEDVLLRHPAVGDVAVVGAPSERWGEEPVAFVRPRDGGPLDPTDLDAWVRVHLAGFKRPRRWYVVDALPLTASGKVQKFVLRDQLRSS
jgi:fatty-acyl-CoA synthase